MRHILPAEDIPLTMPLLEGIDATKARHVLSCLQARYIRFDADDVICRAATESAFVAYLLAGSAVGATYDEQGNKSIIHEFQPGQVISCGTVFGVRGLNAFDIYTREGCDLVYFTTENPQVKCERCARYVNIVKANLAQSMVELNAELFVTLDIRRRRTSRGKIVAYLENQAKQHGSNSFDISFNRQELADYLCIDRAALSRELSHLHDEGQIDYDRNHFVLHLKPRAPKHHALVS